MLVFSPCCISLLLTASGGDSCAQTDAVSPADEGFYVWDAIRQVSSCNMDLKLESLLVLQKFICKSLYLLLFEDLLN